MMLSYIELFTNSVHTHELRLLETELHSPMTVTFLGLPNDILILVLQGLLLTELSALSQTCQLLHDLVSVPETNDFAEPFSYCIRSTNMAGMPTSVLIHVPRLAY